MKSINLVELFTQVLEITNIEEIPKKDLNHLHKQMHEINTDSVKKFLCQDFFFTDNTRQKYSFIKI